MSGDARTALDRMFDDIRQEERDMLDRKALQGADIRASAEQTKQMEMAMEAQREQFAMQRRQNQLQVALQVIGMDVSRAMVGYETGVAPDKQSDQEFVELRRKAMALLGETLMEGASDPI